MSAMASQITSLTIVHSTVYSSAAQRKHQSSASLTGEFPAQRASNAENVSIWWRHHASTSVRNSRGRSPIGHHTVGCANFTGRRLYVTFNPRYGKVITVVIKYGMKLLIRYLFPNFNGCTVEVWEWISEFIPSFTGHAIIHAGIKVKPC